MKGSVLAQIRVDAGFSSVYEAAGAVGYHPVYLRQMENGQATVSDNALYKLAKGYGLTVEELDRKLKGTRLCHGRSQNGSGRKSRSKKVDAGSGKRASARPATASSA